MRAQLRNRTSAQTGLCKWSLRWCTGGRFGELARRSLRQQGEYHFGEYPASCQIRLLGGQLTEPKQRFEALEQQLDLPAQSIKLQDRLRSIFLRQTRQQENEFGCPQGTRINFLADLKRSSDHLFACDLSLFRRQTSDNQTQFQMGSLRIARIDKNRAAYRIPFDLIESGKQVERFALGREQTKRIPAHANHEIRTTVENERQLARACIIAITQPNIARAPLKSAQPLGPAIVGQFEVIHPTRQIICQVEPVRGAIRAGMADGAGINHAQPASFPCSTDLGARFFDEPARNELEPICGVAESLVKRWPRDLRYSTCLRPGAASNQGIAARIHKRKSQKVAWGFYAPRSEKSFELAGRLIDCDQLADPSQSRGPGTKPERIAHAWRNRSPMVNLKLTPMRVGVRGGGMRGPERATVGLERRLRRQATDAETKLWFALRDRRLGGFKFVRQEAIGSFIVDFASRDKKLIVEVDGGQHADSVRDRVRDEVLRADGYRILRFWNSDVLANRDGVLSVILAKLEEAGT